VIVAAVAPWHASTATGNRAVNLPPALVRGRRTIRPSCVVTVTLTTIPGLNEAPRSWRGDLDTTVTVGPAAIAGTATAKAAAAVARRRSTIPRACTPHRPRAEDPNRVLTL
jgi:hypothetical protein